MLMIITEEKIMTQTQIYWPDYLAISYAFGCKEHSLDRLKTTVFRRLYNRRKFIWTKKKNKVKH